MAEDINMSKGAIHPRDIVRIIAVLINRLDPQDAPPFKPHVLISYSLMRRIANEPSDPAFKSLLPFIRDELNEQFAWLMMQLMSGDFLLFHSNVTTPFANVLPYSLTEDEKRALMHGDPSSLLAEYEREGQSIHAKLKD